MSGKKKPPKKNPATLASANNKAVRKKKNYLLILIPAVIIFVTAIAYSNSLSGDLLNFDDVEYFNNYPEVRDLSMPSVAKYFSEYYVIMYQPLPVLSFALNYHFTGLETKPMHLVNLLMHMISVLLVFFFIHKLSGRKDVAGLVALLFAIHPMNVEAVTWISARSSSMYTMFYLGALIFYLNYLKEGNFKLKYLFLTLLFFLLSLFSKAQAVTFPVVLLLMDYFIRKKFEKRLLLQKIPFFILSIIFGIITISDKGTMGNITEGMMVSYTFFDGFFLICYSFVFYLIRLFYPADLCAVYVYPPKTGGMLPWEYYASPLVLIVISILVILAMRKRSYVFFGIFLFLITISLNIQIIPSRLFIVTDRYAYFPYIGLFFIIAMYVSELFSSSSQRARKAAVPAIMIVLIFSAFFTYASHQRNKVWSSDIIFMTDIINKNPEVPYISRAYGNRGHAWSIVKNYSEAISDFTKAIEINPEDVQSFYNRGLMYMNTQQYANALPDFNKAASMDSSIAIIYSNRAVAKFNLLDYDGALKDSDKAIRLDPTLADAYNVRGACRFFVNDFSGSESDFTQAITLRPTFVEALRNRGTLYIKTGKTAEACSDWQTASSLGDPLSTNLIQENCLNQ